MKLKYIFHNLKYCFGLEKTYCSAKLFKLFKEFNKKYFNDELPEIPIYVDDGLGNVWGRFCYNLSMFPHKIKPEHILIHLDVIPNEEILKNVFVHEMVHCWETIHTHPTFYQWVSAHNVWTNELMCEKINVPPTHPAWQKIFNILGLECNGDFHGEKFRQKCHELNEQFPDLALSINVFSEKL